MPEILNERPEGMEYELYREIRSKQKKMIKQKLRGVRVSKDYPKKVKSWQKRV